MDVSEYSSKLITTNIMPERSIVSLCPDDGIMKFDFTNELFPLNRIKVFADADECVDYITSEGDDKKIFFIVSNDIGKFLIPLIHDFSQIDRIYMPGAHNQTWTNEYVKILPIVDDESSTLFEQIQTYLGTIFYEQNTELNFNDAAKHWFINHCNVPPIPINIQYILILFDHTSYSLFSLLIQQLFCLPNVHIEIKHDVDEAYQTMSIHPFEVWRVVIDNKLAKQFVNIRKKKMVELHFVASVIIYSPIFDSDLFWAENYAEQVWGGVKTELNEIIRFCSGDPMAPDNWKLDIFLNMTKKDASFHSSHHYISPFKLKIDEKESNDMKKSNKISIRDQRFSERQNPHFVLDMSKDFATEFFSALLIPPNADSTLTQARMLTNMICYARINDRPIEHIKNRLFKWLFVGPCCFPDRLTGIYCLRAYTEETFLYKDLNRAMAMKDKVIIKYFQEYIHKCLKSFYFKCIPYFAGILYRGVQLSAEELSQYPVGVKIFFPGFMSTSKSLPLVTFLGTNTIFVIQTLTAKHQERLQNMYTNADLHISNVSVMPNEE